MKSSPNILAALRRLSRPLEIWTDPEKIEPYLHDEAARSKQKPIAVLFPRTAKDVAKILKFATKHRLAVIPRGAGSGLSGGALPTIQSLVLSLERMNHILEIDEASAVAVVEPGVITGEIRKAAEERQLFYPPVPASVDLCTIGGNIATNAGSLCAVKYGGMRDYILGLEVVLPTGEIIQTGGRNLKSSTGYNLTQLIIGSEGTLGVVTKIFLRLIPLPKERVTILAPFSHLDQLSQAVVTLLSEGIVPPTLELIPKEAIRYVLERHPELSYPYPDAKASLLLELDAQDAASLETQIETLQISLERSGSGDPLMATTSVQRDKLWEVRKQIRDSVANSGEYEEADSVVPRRNIPALLRAAEACGKRHNLEVISYGHAGDGNLHTYFLRGDTSQALWKKESKKALKAFFQETIKLGGTISGEHGIGLLKKSYLPIACSRTEIDLMRKIKKAFDPKNILNPDKLFPH